MPKRLRIKERRNSMISRARKHARHGVRQKYMKGMFMPLYKSTWKGNGINNVMWNTNVDLDSATYNVDLPNDATATNTVDWLNKAGDLNSVQCLPGRQIYMEFCALPIFKITDVAGTLTSRSLDLFKGGYMRSFADLFQDCLNNHPFTTGGYVSHENDIPSTSATTPFTAVYSLIKDNFMTVSGNLNQNDAYLQRLINSTFMYEGGNQVHKFTNTTTLPVYIEIREFTPKTLMSYSISRGDFPDYLTGTAITTNYVNRYPGLYETIYLDRKSQASAWANNTNNGSVHNNADMNSLFDEVDDKDFKIKGKMAITNMRWKLGACNVHRIDPGETFTYTMILPPFSIKLIDMFNFMRNYRNHVTGAVSQNLGTDLDNNGGYGFNPKFSKFCAIRAWGSKGFVGQGYATGATGTSAGFDQFDSYRPMEQTLGGGNFANRATNSAIPTDTNDTSVRNPTTMKAAMITHAARLNHEMSETHSCRLLPFVRTFAIDQFNWLPNAKDSKLVNIMDNVFAIDPAENDMEIVGGDNGGPEDNDTAGKLGIGVSNNLLRDPNTDGFGTGTTGIEKST